MFAQLGSQFMRQLEVVQRKAQQTVKEVVQERRVYYTAATIIEDNGWSVLSDEPVKLSKEETIRTGIAKHLQDRVQENMHTMSSVDGNCVPGINLKWYVDRLRKGYNCSDVCLVYAMVYLERVSKREVVTLKNVHRLLAVATMIAAKFLEDEFYANGWYARISGMPKLELARLERSFLEKIDYRIVVSEEEVAQWEDILFKAGKDDDEWTLL
mmetsp:Transcript_35306/g.75230  ORF Transcript_35306/g.75230 Transcript_35306/m.75230 type:complete len:212 (-) Transcript_35306:36-671(-)